MKRLVNFVLVLLLSVLPSFGSNSNSWSQQIASGKQLLAKGKYAQAFQLFYQARHDAQSKNDPRGIFEAEVNMGVSYSFVLEYGKAMQYYCRAAEICTSARLGWQQKTYVDNAIAGVYFSEKQYSECVRMLRECLQLAMNNRDTVTAASYSLNLAKAYLSLNQVSRADSCYRFLRRVQGSHPGLYSRSVQALHTELLFSQKRWNEYVVEATAYLKSKDVKEVDKSPVRLHLVRALIALNRTDEALKSALGSANLCNIEVRPDIYRTIADLYRSNGQLDKALAYKDSTEKAVDEQSYVYNHQLAENSKYKLDLYQVQTQVDQQMMSLRYRNHLFTALFFIALLVLALAVTAYFHQRQHKLLAVTQMHEAELETKYRQAMMQRELEKKSRELSASSLFEASRNQLLADLLERLSGIESLRNVPEVSQLSASLASMLKRGKDQEQFIKDFESAHPGMLKRIAKRHPDLTSSDLRFLAYVSMNMTNQEMGSLMNVSPDSCKKRRTRISKKLGLKSSAELYQYVINM